MRAPALDPHPQTSGFRTPISGVSCLCISCSFYICIYVTIRINPLSWKHGFFLSRGRVEKRQPQARVPRGTKLPVFSTARRTNLPTIPLQAISSYRKEHSRRRPCFPLVRLISVASPISNSTPKNPNSRVPPKPRPDRRSSLLVHMTR